MFEKQTLSHLCAALYIPQHTLAGTGIEPSFQLNSEETPILFEHIFIPRLRMASPPAFLLI